jgi:hypothetical protein
MSDSRVRLLDPLGDPRPALEALDAVAVEIVVPGTLAKPTASAVAALVALTVRLFPNVTVIGDAELGPNCWGVETVTGVLKASATVRPISGGQSKKTLRVGIGSEVGSADLYLGGGAFTVRAGTSPQQLDHKEIADYDHAIGVHAGACLIAADLAKIALSPLGRPYVQLPETFVFNLVDYRLTPTPEFGQRTSAPTNILLAAAGSVGSSAAAILAASPGVKGAAVIVDLDTLDPLRNPFRYPALTGAETGPKSEWVSNFLREAGWNTTPYNGELGTWCAEQPSPGFNGILVSSVDTPKARFDVADVFARTTCSIGVAGLALHAQIESLGDGLACPYCDFVALEPALSQADVLAAHLGLQGGVARVIELQQPAAFLTAEDVNQVVAAGRVKEADSASLIGRRLDDIVARVYAESPVTFPDAGTTGSVAVAAPHVSWLAGVLGAVEVAKAAAGLPRLERRIDIDLVGLPQGFTTIHPQDTSGRCACGSGHRKRWMDRLWRHAA